MATTSSGIRRPRTGRYRWHLAVLAVMALAASLLVAGPGYADPVTDETTLEPGNSVAAAASMIQPGASIIAGSSNCTLNWVYDEVLTEDELQERDPRVLVGTAGHCVETVGQEVSLQETTFAGSELPFGEVAYIDDDLDYAFIEVWPEHHDLVNPALKGHPAIPAGVSTQATASQGDTMQFSGHGVGFHATEPTQEERIGVLNHNDGVQHHVTGPVTQGDSGGPVADLTDGGKAFGLVNTVGVGLSTDAMMIVLAGEGGLSLEGLLADADTEGWTVEVRTVDAS